MLTCDLHCHSQYSFDGSATLESIYRSALDRKIDIVCITDHCDMTEGDEGISSYLGGEAARIRDYQEVRDTFSGVEFLYGVEIGNPMNMPEETKRFLETRTFDEVIGSIHFLPDGSDIYKLPYNSAKEIDEMFRSYFPYVEELVDLGGFDTLAHLEYPVRKLEGKISEPTILPYRDLIEPILEKLVRRDIAMEVNTRGTYDWQKRVGPGLWVLKRYRELGGKLITIGSDSHSATLIGEGFAQAAEALKATGFDAYTVYRNRVPHQLPLDATNSY